MFLAVCFEVAGFLGLSAHKLVFAAAVQNAIGLLIVPIMFAMGRLFSRDAANLAAAFGALNMNMAVYGTQILTESLFYPLFAFGLLVMFRYKASGETLRIAAAALIFGFCSLIRPVAMFLPLFMIPYLLVERSAGSAARNVMHAVLFAVLFAAAASPWLVRNQALYGHMELTAQGVPHIVGWVLPAVTRHEKGMDLDRAMQEETRDWAEHRERLPAEIRDNPMALSKEAKSYGMKRMLEASPVAIAEAWFWGAVKNLFAPVAVELAYILQMDWTHFYETPGDSALEQGLNFLLHNKNRTYSFMLAAGIFLTLAFRLVQLVGAWRCARSRPGVLVLSIVVIAYFLAVSGPVGYAKYRLPYEPVFVLLTALAVERWLFRGGDGGGVS
jgi:4-amino-4-deoxy-L-arabinose transferase-like glycosyltransferase